MSDSSPERLDLLAARAGNLYTLPAVAMQVLQLTGHPKVDTAALKQCLENDPALTSRVLKVVNSSLFGLSREVVDLNQALALLGTKPLKLLVLGFSLPERLFTGVGSKALGYYWRHTLTKAVAAREMSERFFDQPGDEAFIAGLLSDLGTLVLLQDLGQPYAEFLHRSIDGGGDLLALERSALGFDHTQLSARLLASWGLPQSLVEAVAAPKQVEVLLHDPLPHGLLPRLLHLAELLAQVVTDHRLSALPELLEAADAYCGVKREPIKQLVAVLDEKVAALAEVLSLQLPDGRAYHEVLQEAHHRLADVAADVAKHLLRADQDELLHNELLAQTRALGAAAARLAHVAPVQCGAAAVVASAAAKPSAARQESEDAKASVWRCPPVRRRGRSLAVQPDAHFSAELAAAAARCRQQRWELSLLLVEIDHFADWVVRAGGEAAQRVALLLKAACQGVDHPHLVLLQPREGYCALLLPDCDRRLAVELAGHTRRTLQRFGEAAFRSSPLPLSVSVGAATVAVVPRNFPPHDLFDSAQRCLHAAQACGGAAVKSIEI